MLSTLTHEGDRQGEGSRRGGRKRILVGRDRKSLSKHRRGEGGRENRGRGRPSRRIGSRKRTFISYCVRSIYTSMEGWRGRGKTTPDDTALFARQNQRSWQRERVLVCRTLVLPMEIFFFGSSFPYHLPRLFQSPGPVLVCLRPREPKKELYFHPFTLDFLLLPSQIDAHSLGISLSPPGPLPFPPQLKKSRKKKWWLMLSSPPSKYSA